MIQQSAVVLNSGAVKALLRDHRTREDVLEAVLTLVEAGRTAHAMGEEAAASDLVVVFRWADALARWLSTGEGLVLLASHRRAEALLRDAQEDDLLVITGKPQPRLYRTKEERELAVAISLARANVAEAVASGDFERATQAMSVLRAYVQAFFAKVTFDSALADLLENRLRLVCELRDTLCLLGDLSKIELQAEMT